MSKFSLSLLLILLSLFFMGEAQAATTCNFTSVTDVAFGSYDVLSGLNNDSTGSITILCDSNPWTPFTLSIGASPNSGGFTPRKMTSGTDLLSYNLYTTASRNIIWGDGTQGTSTVSGSSKKNSPSTSTIYGRIPASQDVSVGSYSETLVITLDY